MVTVALVAALVPAPAFAVSFNDLASCTDGGAILALSSLGVIDGYDDGTFRPDASITRAEVAALIVRCLGLEDQAKADTAPTKFSDVSSRHAWAYGYINRAAEREIIIGDPGGTFRPAGKVTGGEAITMIVRALGREPSVDKAAGWPTGHQAVAVALGILPTGRDAEMKATATRAIVARYLDRALTVEIAQLKADGTLTGSGTSFVSLLGGKSYDTFVAAAGVVADEATGQTCALVPDGTLAENAEDGQNDAIPISPDVAVYGTPGITFLSARFCRLITDRNGMIVYAAPARLDYKVTDFVTRVVDAAAGKVITFQSGAEVTTVPHPSIRRDGAELGDAGWAAMVPGESITATVDLSTNLATQVDVYDDRLSGTLRFQDGRYTIAGSQWTVIDPADPNGMLTPETVITIDTLPATEGDIRSELEDPGRVAKATLILDAVTGKAARLEVRTFDGYETFEQPLTGVDAEIVDGTLAIRIKTPLVDWHYIPTEAIVIKDGEQATIFDILVGDNISYRTYDGMIVYIEANVDRKPPIAVMNGETISFDGYKIRVDEPLLLESIRLTIDGVPYDQNLGQYGPAFGANYFAVEYYPDNWGSRTLINVHSAQGLTDGPHTLCLEATDASGNKMSLTRTVEQDTTPASAAATFSPDRLSIDVTFDDEVTREIRPVESWQYQSGGAIVSQIASITGLDDLVHMTIKLSSPAKSGDVLTGKGHDMAGNEITIRIVAP